jgi:hypothetical protein
MKYLLPVLAIINTRASSTLQKKKTTAIIQLVIGALLVSISLGCAEKGSRVQWPPRSGEHDTEAASIPDQAQPQIGVPRDDPISYSGMQTPGPDGQFWPLRGSFMITGGSYQCKVADIEKRAKLTDWAYVYKDDTRTEKAGWAICATSGQMLLPKALFLNPREGLYAENHYVAEDFGEKYILVRLDPAKGHRVCILANGYFPTVGCLGSKVDVGGITIERRKDGWYSGTRRVDE